MSLRIKRVAAVAMATAGVAGTAIFATAPAANAQNVLHVCPAGYYGVEVYDPQGRSILWACVRL